MRLTSIAVAVSFAAALCATGASAAPSPSSRRRAKVTKTREAAPAPAAPAAEVLPPLPSVPLVVDRINDLFRADSSEARFTMKIVTSRHTRELVLQSFTRGKQEALIVVQEPAREAGMATLRSAEGLWSYAPRADRLVRIPSSLLSDSWMGSHFTNDDLMRETDFARDYDATVAWVKEGGRRLLRLTLKPRPEAPVVWSHVVYDLDSEDYLPLRASYYDGGEVARSLTFADPHVVKGRRVPFSLRMVPVGKAGEATALEYQEIKFDVEIDPSVFTQRGLRRGVKP